MKLHTIVYFLIFAIGIGAAMSIALNDTSVGMAIGSAIGIVFAVVNTSKDKNPKSK